MLSAQRNSGFFGTSFSNTHIIAIALSVIVLAMGLIAYQFHFFDVSKYFHPQKPNPLIATVGTKKIYLADLQNEAVPNGLRETTDKKVLQQMLDKLEERDILQITGEKLSIDIPQTAVDSQVANLVKAGAKATPSLKQSVKDQLLKDAITQKVVNNRYAYLVGFWIPPLDYPDPLTAEEKSLFAKMRQDGTLALPEIETKMKNNEAPTLIAQDILRKYPSLNPRLAVNGFLLTNTKDQGVLTKPKLFVYTDQTKGIPLYETLFSMKDGEVKTLLGENGSGGQVIKLVSSTNSDIHSYGDWLKEQKQQLVKVVNPL